MYILLTIVIEMRVAISVVVTSMKPTIKVYQTHGAAPAVAENALKSSCCLRSSPLFTTFVFVIIGVDATVELLFKNNAPNASACCCLCNVR